MMHFVYVFLIGLISNLMWPVLVRSVAEGHQIRASVLAFINGMFFVLFVKILEYNFWTGVSWSFGLMVGMYLSFFLRQKYISSKS